MPNHFISSVIAFIILTVSSHSFKLSMHFTSKREKRKITKKRCFPLNIREPLMFRKLFQVFVFLVGPKHQEGKKRKSILLTWNAQQLRICLWISSSVIYDTVPDYFYSGLSLTCRSFPKSSWTFKQTSPLHRDFEDYFSFQTFILTLIFSIIFKWSEILLKHVQWCLLCVIAVPSAVDKSSLHPTLIPYRHTLGYI